MLTNNSGSDLEAQVIRLMKQYNLDSSDLKEQLYVASKKAGVERVSDVIAAASKAGRLETLAGISDLTAFADLLSPLSSLGNIGGAAGEFSGMCQGGPPAMKAGSELSNLGVDCKDGRGTFHSAASDILTECGNGGLGTRMDPSCGNGGLGTRMDPKCGNNNLGTWMDVNCGNNNLGSHVD